MYRRQTSSNSENERDSHVERATNEYEMESGGISQSGASIPAENGRVQPSAPPPRSSHHEGNLYQ